MSRVLSHETVCLAVVGHKWARPSISHLRSLMRRVYEHPDEARRKGERARKDMVERFSPERVTDILVAEFTDISKIMAKEDFISDYKQAEEEIFESNRRKGDRFSSHRSIHKKKKRSKKSDRDIVREDEEADVTYEEELSEEFTACDAEDKGCIQDNEVTLDLENMLPEEYVAYLEELGVELDPEVLEELEAYQAAYASALHEALDRDAEYHDAIRERENRNSERETVTIKGRSSSTADPSSEYKSDSGTSERGSGPSERKADGEEGFSLPRFVADVEQRVKEGVSDLSKAAKDIGETVTSYPYTDKIRELGEKIDNEMEKAGVAEKMKKLSEDVKGSVKSLGDSLKQYVTEFSEHTPGAEDTSRRSEAEEDASVTTEKQKHDV